MEEYKKFDYFETPLKIINSFRDYVNPEKYKYKIDGLEVHAYIYKIEEDRKRWDFYRVRYKDFPLILLVIITLFLPIIAFFVIYLISSFGISNIDKKIISYFIVYQTVIIEFSMWRNFKFIDIYNKWVEKKYKKRSQFNRIIDEYLEDVNFRYWMKQNKIQSTENI